MTSEIHPKIRNSINRSESHRKIQVVGHGAKTMKDLLQKQLRFDQTNHLRSYSGRPKNSGVQIMTKTEEFDRKFNKPENEVENSNSSRNSNQKSEIALKNRKCSQELIALKHGMVAPPLFHVPRSKHRD